MCTDRPPSKDTLIVAEDGPLSDSQTPIDCACACLCSCGGARLTISNGLAAPVSTAESSDPIFPPVSDFRMRLGDAPHLRPPNA